MATIADLSGDEREERAAELKRKMQEAAKKRAAQSAETAAADEKAEAKSAVTADAVQAIATPVAQPAEAVATAEPAEAEAADSTVATSANTSGNGAAVAEAPNGAMTNGTAIMAPSAISSPPLPTDEEVNPEAAARAEMNRREFLMYTWTAALGLLTVQSGVASYFFLYPRFKAGEFGGDFFKSISDFGAPTAEPAGEMTGKFWMVTTAEGSPKAIYMVCTHLGCLYKWVEANNRFECPCHGSKFSHDGFYIEGPAPRSLDYFEVTVEGAEVVVHTGSKNTGAPSAESPARAVPV